jgi:hypothetical protein
MRMAPVDLGSLMLVHTTIKCCIETKVKHIYDDKTLNEDSWMFWTEDNMWISECHWYAMCAPYNQGWLLARPKPKPP